MDWYFVLLIGIALGVEVGRLSAGRPFHWKKALIALIAGAVVAAGVAAGMRLFSTDVSFIEDGNLVRTTAGRDPAAWFLLYDEPGAPAKSVRLTFDDDSACTDGAVTVVCDDAKIAVGSRVHVEAIPGEDVVLVRRLNIENDTVCTMEAKLCPDGSYVGRTGPKCEFAPCP